MRSIKWKLVMLNLTIVFIVMFICGTFIIVRIENIETGKAKQELNNFSAMVVEQVVDVYQEETFQRNLNALIKTELSGLQCSILDSRGVTIATTLTQNEPYPQFNTSSIVSAIAGTKTFSKGSWQDTSSGLPREYLCYAVPAKINDTVYVVFLQTDMSAINDKLSETKQVIAFSILLAMMLTCFLGYVFSKTLADPVTILTKKSKEIARGKLNQEIEVKSNDEIGQLTRSFNYMAKELKNMLSTVKREKNKLEIVLHTMTDGVVAYDLSGRLLHANSVSYHLLDTMEFSLDMLLKTFDISRSDLKAMKANSTKRVSFKSGKKYINAFFTTYYDSRGVVEGVVVVLQDATEQNKLDEMRKEFVANVSHELRTPLTTIKSYAETLLDGAMDDAEIASEFLETIDSEADRMTLLVKDLLELSRFDNAQFVLNLKPVSLDALIKECIKQTKVQLEQKRQTINYIPSETDHVLNIDSARINQVINNILTNAIKYSGEDTAIDIFLKESSKQIYLYVKDHGIGIPQEDLPRVFERFYRVDKARSRAMGGTGLGLSIAKEIMRSHGGGIYANSIVGTGTTMIMVFPKAN